jgi:capsular exopolysaccharide synthesis family protein
MLLDFKSILRMARHWWWLLLLAPMIGGGTAYYFSSQQPNMYEAEVTMMVSSGVNSGSNPGSFEASKDLIATYTLWVVSRPVLERSADILDYEGGSDVLADHVSSGTVLNTLYMTVSATDTDPERAALIANTVADQFVADVKVQTREQNAQVRSQIDEQIITTNNSINQLNTSIRELESLRADITAAENSELQALRQQRADLQTDLDQLQTTARSIDVELASAQTRITVTSEAVAPSAPYAPNTMQAGAIGGVLGLIIAIAGVFVVEYLDNTVRNREELSRVAEAPVLAAIATAPGTNRSGGELFVLRAPNSAASEAIRLLRANLEFASAPDPLTSLAISSPDSQDGKSTITANLGVVMTQAGLKTVIIDADLRRPTQHKIFGVPNTQGLSTLLTKPNPDWRTAAVSLSIPNLVLIPSGPLPPNPSDLLSLDRFSRILADVGEWADVVLIDTSPVLAASDALVVATKANGALLVCRAGETRYEAVKHATSAFRHGRAPILGMVLNRNKTDIDQYGQYANSTGQGDMPSSRFYYGSKSPELVLGRTIVSTNGKKHPPRPSGEPEPVIHEM